MKTKTAKLNINKILTTHLLFLGIILTAFSYLYLLNLSAFNSSAVEKTSDVVASIQSEIATLEFNFIEKNRAIKDVNPADFGLVTEINEKEKVFVKKSDANRLTFNE